MNALTIHCTLKPPPEASNTEALAQVVADALAKEGVTVDGVLAGGPGDIGHTVPGQAWTTYWHLGPGPGRGHLDDERGHDHAARSARTLAANLVTAARALATAPLPAPAQ